MNSVHRDDLNKEARLMRVLCPALVCGFATAVAMWVVCFIAHVEALGLRDHPAVVATALLLAQLIGGVFTGRAVDDRRLLVCGMAGMVTGVLNLLVLGAVLVSKPAAGASGLSDNAPLFAAGYLALSVCLGLAGGFVGGMGQRRADVSEQVWLARFAIVLCIAILPLLFIGGLVTSSGAGMAVPDWPTSFGANMFLYPVSLMTGKIYYEHTHRLFGSLVGLTAGVLMFVVLWREPVRTTKVLAVGLFIVISLQGLLGAYRVKQGTAQGTADAAPAAVVQAAPPVLPPEPVVKDAKPPRGPKVLAMLHGVSGQITFAGAVWLAVMLAPSYVRSTRGSSSASRRLRPLAAGLLVCLIVQLVFGAMLRHLGGPHATWSHVGFSIVVVVVGAILAFALGKAAKNEADPAARLYRRLGKAVQHCLGLQFVLGWAAFWVLFTAENPTESTARIVLGTLHQFNGALLLAVVVVTVIWTRRLIQRGTL